MKQFVSNYTGEGAYHGSTNSKPQIDLNPWGVSETEPSTVRRCISKRSQPESFSGLFSRKYEEVSQLQIPSQSDLSVENTNFAWKAFSQAQLESGPITQEVLSAIKPYLQQKKLYCYVDVKTQYFEKGDLAVDSNHFHIDGTVVVRGSYAERLGYPIVHDMRARFNRESIPPQYFAYQSSDHCPTCFVSKPIQLIVPELIPNFNEFDNIVRRNKPHLKNHPAGSIIHYDGQTIHAATPATKDGWRLWIRVIETDKKISASSEISQCYKSVYRQT